jgi:hypothetical protein
MEFLVVTAGFSLLLRRHFVRPRSTDTLKISPSEPQCIVLPGPPLPGQDKWLGGMSSWDGKYIYGVPGGSQQVLCIDTESGDYKLLGGPYVGKFKWLRGVTCPKCVYALPSNAHSILKINPITQTVSEVMYGANGSEKWQWHGGVYCNGHVFAVPCNAEHVLKINADTDEVELIGGPWKGLHKWYGGILASNDCMYCIPQTATGVLKVNTKTSVCTIIGEEECTRQLKDCPGGGWAWHGGTVTNDGKLIFGIPSNADYVLKINTVTDKVTTIGPKLESGRHRIPQDGRYKYLGSAMGQDGIVYMFPCDAERVLAIDPVTDNVKYVGPYFLGTDKSTYKKGEAPPLVVEKVKGVIKSITYVGENKWQNGFAARDGCVYAIPQRAPGILRIVPSHDPQQEAEVGLVLVAEKGHEKYEGAVMGADGCIYCIPLRAKKIVKLVPGGAKVIGTL